MKRVLAMQHIWDDSPGFLGEVMREHGIACDVVQVDKETLPDATAYNAIVALGGPQNANEDDKYPYLAAETEFIRRAVEQGVPYLGICLGGQLLARALGAAVTRHSLTEIGFYKVQLTEEGKADPLFAHVPTRPQVIQWHEDVFDLPRGSTLLASGEHTPFQAFRFGRLAYGLQYHIELTAAMLAVWLQFPEFQAEIVKVLGTDAPARIAREGTICFPRYHAHSRQVFENFLKLSGCL